MDCSLSVDATADVEPISSAELGVDINDGFLDIKNAELPFDPLATLLPRFKK